MTTYITVYGLYQPSLNVCRIEVDEYIPLRFRSYEGALGVNYLRLGNFDTSLLELLIEPSAMAVRGFNLTSVDAIHEPRAKENLSKREGLPIIRLPEDLHGPFGAQRFDIKQNFSVGLAKNFLEIDFGNISHAQYVAVAGSVEFYVGSIGMAGLRVVNLPENDISSLKAMSWAK
ncbi:hypothetical protein [Acidovorax sp. Leaf78]|uniref:hypothetical protein n=1 Tax=unclassified Acidovorax TaxID=2684926 RepID=UPI0012E26BDA|nr:hypothetical protein [Acidovorax sp. Leaf78]